MNGTVGQNGVMRGDSTTNPGPDPMPNDVVLAAEVLGSPHNSEIASYLAAHSAATFGQISKALQERGVDVVKGTLSHRLRTLEGAGVITGDLPRDQRGRGKVVRYSLVPTRLQYLVSRQLDYMLGLLPQDGHAGAAALHPTADAGEPFGPVSAQILNMLASHSPATLEEIREHIDDRAARARLTTMVGLGFVTEDAEGRFRISRSGVAEAARVLFNASVTRDSEPEA